MHGLGCELRVAEYGILNAGYRMRDVGCDIQKGYAEVRRTAPPQISVRIRLKCIEQPPPDLLDG
jgi:hypothetical protein